VFHDIANTWAIFSTALATNDVRYDKAVAHNYNPPS
jgi:hypothetical protein